MITKKILSIILAGFAFVLFVPESEAYFTVAFGPDSVLFSEIETHAEALDLADAIQAGSSVIDNNGVLIINNDITINGLSATQRAEMIDRLTNVTQVQVSSFINTSGLLRYQVSVSANPNRNQMSVGIVASPAIVAPNQTFTLRWLHQGFSAPVCTLRAAGPVNTPAPAQSLVQQTGSVPMTLTTPGDYLFTYSCTEGSTTREMWQRVKVTNSATPVEVQISSANCFIDNGLSECTTSVTWDYLLNGPLVIQSATIHNITTQTLVSTDPQGILRPISLRYGSNTIAYSISALSTTTGAVYRASGTLETFAACMPGTTWNGSVCTGAQASDYWGILSDIGFYGPGYRGMPSLSVPESMRYNNPYNSSCNAIDFWICDTRDDQQPVQFELFVDNELVLTDRTNLPVTVEGWVNPSWEGARKYRRTPACGMSDHLQYLYVYRLPAYLKDNQVHSLKIKATRSDGLSKWVTFNGWNGHYDYGYPNSVYQNFSFKCAPDTPTNVIDLAGYLAFPTEVSVGAATAITEARVLNAGLVPLASSTRVAIQFDYNRDNPSGSGGVNDFTIWTTVNNIASGQLVYANFADVVLPVAGNWRTRIWVDPQNLIEPWVPSPTSTRHNNASFWVNVVAVDNNGLPQATLNPGNCVIPVGGSGCDTTVRWTSSNFVDTTEVLQGNTVFSSVRTSNGVTRRVDPDNRRFTVRDAGSSYSLSASADVRCAEGTHWNTSRRLCVAGQLGEVTPPDITIKTSQPIVRYGDTTVVTVDVTSTYDVRCTIEGLGRASQTFSHTTGTNTYTFTTNPIFGQQTITVTCDDTSTSAIIEVVPEQQEV